MSPGTRLEEVHVCKDKMAMQPAVAKCLEFEERAQKLKLLIASKDCAHSDVSMLKMWCTLVPPLVM